jgi:hypothetical protein
MSATSILSDAALSSIGSFKEYLNNYPKAFALSAQIISCFSINYKDQEQKDPSDRIKWELQLSFQDVDVEEPFKAMSYEVSFIEIPFRDKVYIQLTTKESGKSLSKTLYLYPTNLGRGVWRSLVNLGFSPSDQNGAPT